MLLLLPLLLLICLVNEKWNKNLPACITIVSAGGWEINNYVAQFNYSVFKFCQLVYTVRMVVDVRNIFYAINIVINCVLNCALLHAPLLLQYLAN